MKNILFIHAACSLGGIETFFIRLARELNINGFHPKFLFLYKSLTDISIEQQLAQFGDIYYWEDISYNYLLGGDRIKLLQPLNRNDVIKKLGSTDCIHVDTALTFFCAKRIIACFGASIKLVFGVYHANELAWSFKSGLPIYEKFFREKLFSGMTELLFFNNFSSQVTKRNNNISFLREMVFPLGVDLPDRKKIKSTYSNELKIVSVGRLVSFKTYNLFMPKVIQELNRSGINVSYDVYGDGPLYSELSDMASEVDLKGSINYKGPLEYSDLDDVLLKYDLFIGSGTALLHAAANGLPSIIAIENELNPLTYGFFSDLPGIDYHEQKLPFERTSIRMLISDFSKMTAGERIELSKKHIEKASVFGIKDCTNKFLESFHKASPISGSCSNFYKFIFLFASIEIMSHLFKKEKYAQKYDQILQ